MGEIDLKKLQKELGKMFFDLTSILDKNNIPYFAVGGTLLGAVRHQGFIPWDDDVDISLLREDYDRFIAIANQILPEPYILELPSVNSNYPYLFAKVYNKNTTLVEGFSQPIKRGVYIDIFPIDGIDSDKQIQSYKIRRHRLLQKMYRRLYGGDVKSRYFWGRVFHPMLSYMLKLLFPKKKIIELITKNIKPPSEYNYINNYFGSWREKEVQDKSWYQESIQLQFLDFKVRCPLEYDKILTQLYGDYMSLPPKEKQVSHHTISYLDLDSSYLDNELKL